MNSISSFIAILMVSCFMTMLSYGVNYAAKGDLHTGLPHTTLTVPADQYLIIGGKNDSKTEYMFYYVLKDGKEIISSGTVAPGEGFCQNSPKGSGEYQVFYRFFPEIEAEGSGRVGLFKLPSSTRFTPTFYNYVVLPQLGYS
jgi:hypothetical protein